VSDFRGRIIDGVNSLLEKVGVDDTPLSGVDNARLQSELEARVDARNKNPRRAPKDNPRAAMAAGTEAAAKRRKAAASAREKRIHGVREQKRRSDQRAQDEAFRRMREKAAREGPSPGPSPGSSSGSSGSSSRRSTGFRGFGKDAEIAKAYKTLDLPQGADATTVKSAYRKLMRKYHPDLHNQSPQKQKAATELTMQVTQAYNTLNQHLSDK
jgi:DnaJ-domain-containing protein 1